MLKKVFGTLVLFALTATALLRAAEYNPITGNWYDLVGSTPSFSFPSDRVVLSTSGATLYTNPALTFTSAGGLSVSSFTTITATVTVSTINASGLLLAGNHLNDGVADYTTRQISAKGRGQAVLTMIANANTDFGGINWYEGTGSLGNEQFMGTNYVTAARRGDWEFYNQTSAGDFVWYLGVSNTQRAILTTSGNFGVGASVPAARLHVSSGALLIDGSPTGFTIGKSTDTAITRIMTGSASLNFGATAASSCDALTITVDGAADGDVVVTGIPATLAGADANGFFPEAYVSAANTVTIKRCNLNAGVSLSDPVAATVNVKVIH